MVQTAIADIISPSVPAEGPNALLREEFFIIPNKVRFFIINAFNSRQKSITDFTRYLRVFALFQISSTCFFCNSACFQLFNLINQLSLDGVLSQQISIRILCVILKE